MERLTKASEIRDLCELRYDKEEGMYYAVEKSKLQEAIDMGYVYEPKGMPIPSDLVKNWTGYILKYDPFSWWTNRIAPATYAAQKTSKRKREKRIAAKLSALTEE